MVLASHLARWVPSLLSTSCATGGVIGYVSWEAAVQLMPLNDPSFRKMVSDRETPRQPVSWWLVGLFLFWNASTIAAGWFLIHMSRQAVRDCIDTGTIADSCHVTYGVEGGLLIIVLLAALVGNAFLAVLTAGRERGVQPLR